jgi:hypothetical protein
MGPASYEVKGEIFAIMNLSPSDLHHPNLFGESCPSTASSPVDAARESSNPHDFLAQFARVYDTARGEGAGVAEAMALVEAELLRELEQRRR